MHYLLKLADDTMLKDKSISLCLFRDLDRLKEWANRNLMKFIKVLHPGWTNSHKSTRWVMLTGWVSLFEERTGSPGELPLINWSPMRAIGEGM